MPALPPKITVDLAKDVYVLSTLSTSQQALAEVKRLYGDLFAVNEQNLLKAKTGGPGILKCQTAFGLLLSGNGVFKGHYFLVFRGTAYLADMLTDLNATVSRASCGELVHDGFNKTFNSLKPQVLSFINSIPKQNIKSLHCVGHSLGGAVATLCAQWLVQAFGHNTYLYTYGSPRVGLHRFSRKCTSTLKPEKIFRVYHRTDPIPAVPTWPYDHTPVSGIDYYLASPGLVLNPQYHRISHYVASVQKIGDSWRLLQAHKKEVRSEASIIKWLEGESVISLTLKTLELLADALSFVLRKSLIGFCQVADGVFTNHSTLADKIAYILTKSIDLGNNVSNWVLCLIQKMVYLLGHPQKIDKAMLTREYIRHVLIRMQHRLNAYAKEALSQALVQGRAI
jgi:triacylglycerol lipase